MSEADSSAGHKLNVFISYSRDDLYFADQLDAALKLAGFATALDRHGISGGEDWRRRLGALIRDADTVVFVLSPASATSEICAWEVAEAASLNKRIIPVLSRPLEGVSPPRQLADLNYIFFYDEPKSPGSGFGTGQVRLVTALNTDLEWLREHTRLLQRATEWDTGGRPENRLLSGGDITGAKAWAARRPKDAPEPTTLHLDFIRTSEEVEEKRQNTERHRLEEVASAQAERAKALEEREIAQIHEAEQARRVVRRTLAGLAVALLLAVVAGAAGLFAWQQQQVASTERDRARGALARVLADRSWSALSAGNKDLAIRYALSGWRVAPGNAAYYRAPLAQALMPNIAPSSVHRLHDGRLTALAASGKYLVSGGEDGKIVLLDATSGNLIGSAPNAGAAVRAVFVEPSGERVLIVTDDAGIRILDVATRQPLLDLRGHANTIVGVTFSPDGRRLATASYESVRLWDLSTGKLLATLLGHQATVEALVFSPDGRLLVTASGDNTTKIWDPATGRELGRLVGHAAAVTSVAFSPDGHFILTGSDDRSVIAWDASQSFQLSKKLSNHAAGVQAVSFGSDGSRAYVIDVAGNAYIWDWRNERIIVATARGSDQFGFASFGLGGTHAAITGEGGVLRLWDSEAARIVTELRSGEEAKVSTLLWSGHQLIVGDESGALAIYDLASVTLPIEHLAARACAKEHLFVPRFTWMESATDPLIREVWDPQGNSRSVCE